MLHGNATVRQDRHAESVCSASAARRSASSGRRPTSSPGCSSDALDAGLNVIDTAECYLNSEELIGQAVARRRNDFYLFTKCGHPEGMGQEDWRPESLLQSIERSLQRLKTDRRGPDPAPQLLGGGAAQGRRDHGPSAGPGEGVHTLHWLQRGRRRRRGTRSSRGAFDALQTSVSIADQEAIELTLPLARARQMGVIAKRPIANAVWRHCREAGQRLLPALLGAAPGAGLRLPAGRLARGGLRRAAIHAERPGRAHGDRRDREAGPLAGERRTAGGRAPAPRVIRGHPGPLA